MIGFYRKNKKKVIIFTILFLVAAGGFILYFNIRGQKVPVEIYVEDYPEIYAEELRIIFGEDCEIGEKKTFYQEGEICGCGWVDPTIQHDTWEVTYHDRTGETYTQTINNMYSLESLQCSWLKSHLEQYYEKKYLIDYFDEGTFEGLTAYCRVSIGAGEFWCSMDKKEEYNRIMEGKRKYKEQLLESYKNRDTMLRLSELNCEEIYNHYPIITSFGLSIGDGELFEEEKEVYEKAVQDRVLEMIKAIQRDTDYTCNLEVQVDSANGFEDLYDNSRSWRYYFLQGKRFEPEGEPNVSYGFAHAYAYEGIYW